MLGDLGLVAERRHLEVPVRGPGRKRGTAVSGWQQQLASRIGGLGHAPAVAVRVDVLVRPDHLHVRTAKAVSLATEGKGGGFRHGMQWEHMKAKAVSFASKAAEHRWQGRCLSPRKAVGAHKAKAGSFTRGVSLCSDLFSCAVILPRCGPCGTLQHRKAKASQSL